MSRVIYKPIQFSFVSNISNLISTLDFFNHADITLNYINQAQVLEGFLVRFIPGISKSLGPDTVRKQITKIHQKVRQYFQKRNIKFKEHTVLVITGAQYQDIFDSLRDKVDIRSMSSDFHENIVLEVSDVEKAYDLLHIEDKCILDQSNALSDVSERCILEEMGVPELRNKSPFIKVSESDSSDLWSMLSAARKPHVEKPFSSRFFNNSERPRSTQRASPQVSDLSGTDKW